MGRRRLREARLRPRRSTASARSASARDGIEHLVFFPMYKQNGSRDTCCEALIVRVPWPDWIAELERTRYDNPKFVPVELVDATRGYDSECAVLFPEMVSVAEPPVEQLRRDLLRPGGRAAAADRRRRRRPAGAQPSARRRADAASPEISEQAYILWDLIHDRTHSHGELPFDPFMIRQRAPYWMYSLEELRCDLTAFGEAVALEREGGVTFARYVQYAILLDRLLRFPITGARVRNYDGLGGQLLFAYLHRHGYLQWADNRLTIEWDRVAEGVGGAARGDRGAVPRRDRPHQAPALGGRPRPRGGERSAGGRVEVGRGRPRPPRARGPAAVRRPGARRRVPAVDLLQLAEGQARGCERERAAATRFASDNAATIHPEVLAAIARVNVGHAFGYGHDRYTRARRGDVRASTSASARGRSWCSAAPPPTCCACAPRAGRGRRSICAETAHLNVDECGAPEAIAGVKLLTVRDRARQADARAGREPRSCGSATSTRCSRASCRSRSAPSSAPSTRVEEVRAIAELAHAHGLLRARRRRPARERGGGARPAAARAHDRRRRRHRCRSAGPRTACSGPRRSCS